jgi:hypothetical protein
MEREGENAVSQNVLIEIPEQPAVVERAVTAAARLKTVNRDQTLLAQICASFDGCG